jgi:predicted amino acid dehydrogenase
MLRRNPDFTYRRINLAAKMAARRGARIIGLGAFTSVIGDAGVTVANRSPIAVTSGNSLTAVITIETGRIALILMGYDDIHAIKAMVVGATGSIGSICARLLARISPNVVCISPESQKLNLLQQKILQETPAARVSCSTESAAHIEDCDLIITAATAVGQKVLDIRLCKPGAVICDVARPPNITFKDAAQRKDVLVIESGEVVIPGEINFGYDLGLPRRTTYACLAETAVLAMEGKYESFSLGREISLEKAAEIYELFCKHQFTIANLRTFGTEVSADVITEKRKFVDQLK